MRVVAFPIAPGRSQNAGQNRNRDVELEGPHTVLRLNADSPNVTRASVAAEEAGATRELATAVEAIDLRARVRAANSCIGFCSSRSFKNSSDR